MYINHVKFLRVRGRRKWSLSFSLILRCLTETYGRRRLQLTCLAAHVVSRVTLLFTASHTVLFVLAESLVLGCSGLMMESAVSVGTELTDVRNRSSINCLSYVAASFGLTCAALCVQKFPSWKYALLFAVLCCLILAIFCRSVCWLTVHVLVLSVGLISVNPLVTVSAQSTALVAAVVLLHFCGSHFGRRWSCVACMVLVCLLGGLSVVLLTVDAPSGGGSPGDAVLGGGCFQCCQPAEHRGAPHVLAPDHRQHRNCGRWHQLLSCSVHRLSGGLGGPPAAVLRAVGPPPAGRPLGVLPAGDRAPEAARVAPGRRPLWQGPPLLELEARPLALICAQAVGPPAFRPVFLFVLHTR